VSHLSSRRLTLFWQSKRHFLPPTSLLRKHRGSPDFFSERVFLLGTPTHIPGYASRQAYGKVRFFSSPTGDLPFSAPFLPPEVLFEVVLSLPAFLVQEVDSPEKGVFPPLWQSRCPPRTEPPWPRLVSFPLELFKNSAG